MNESLDIQGMDAKEKGEAAAWPRQHLQLPWEKHEGHCKGQGHVAEATPGRGTTVEEWAQGKGKQLQQSGGEPPTAVHLSLSEQISLPPNEKSRRLRKAE